MTTGIIKSNTKKKLKNRLACALLFGIIFCIPGEPWAASLITARYLQTQGTEIVVEIRIGSPPPSTLIIEQKLPPGVVITRSKPRVKSQNSAKGRAKWLLGNLRPGTLTLHMFLNGRVTSETISGKIRYREPKSGIMATLSITRE